MYVQSLLACRCLVQERETIRSIRSDIFVIMIDCPEIPDGMSTKRQVMLLRRLITNSGYDDKNNLTLEEPNVAMPTLWLLLGNRTHSSELQRRAWLQLENPPIIMAVNHSGLWPEKLRGEKT